MGRPPAYLFVVRHGHRLDAADKQWHLTSPTPYDPPLTYGGWQQSRALGATIGGILRERMLADEAAGESRSPDSTARRKRKKYKVVIHSSPFLRCIQTSIAISSGLAQDPLPAPVFNSNRQSPAASPVPGANPAARSRPTVVTDLQKDDPLAGKKPRSGGIPRAVLRLDAFLGEWLTPGYFELITHPPGSVMMLASAKADLLRREDYSTYPGFAGHAHSISHGQLWDSASGPFSAPASGLEEIEPLSGSLPSDVSMSAHSLPSISRMGSAAQFQEGRKYVPPTPLYAVSSSATIPMGFVSHARDHCIKVDFQWDSMRAPLDWGDGGEFGEEWASMHKRFRYGIEQLVEWYSTTEDPTDMVTKIVTGFSHNGLGAEEDSGDDSSEDTETEAVVILVSHGAGCNAMIGAITHQPVLLDVAMASLTMAVRKPEVEHELQNGSTEARPRGTASTASPTFLRDTYDLELFANTDHLRSNSATPNSARPSAMAQALGINRGRGPGSFADGYGSRSSSAQAVLGGSGNVRRESGTATRPPRSLLGAAAAADAPGITVGSGFRPLINSAKINTSQPRDNRRDSSLSSSRLSRTPSIGLWTPISRRDEADEAEDEEDEPYFNFGDTATSSTSQNDDPQPSLEQSTPKSPQETPLPVSELPARDTSFGMASIGSGPGERENHARSFSTDAFPSFDAGLLAPLDAIPQLGAGIGGLWGGSPRPPGEAERIRDLTATKRRWTVNEPA